MLNFMFDFGDSVVVMAPHARAGSVGTIEAMPGSRSLHYGVRLHADGPVWEIEGRLLKPAAAGETA